MKDPYEVLGVERNADLNEIKRAYRKKAKQYHPDLNPGDEEAAEHFKELSEAYSILQDSEKRQMYDTYGAAAFENGGMGQGSGFGGFGFDMNDIFGDIFGDLFGGGRSRTNAGRRGPQRGADIQVEISLTFKEAVFGCKKKIKLKREEDCSVCHGTGAEEGSERKTCPRCHGSGMISQETRSPFGRMINQTICPDCRGEGTILEHPCKKCGGSGREKKQATLSLEIPAGVDDGNIMTLRGEGHRGRKGGSPGDVHVIFRVEASKFYQRHGKDLYFEMPLSFIQAALGDTVQVPTLEGKEDFKIPAGTQTGTDFTLKGRGVEDVRGGKRGNLYFRVKLETPTHLTDKQKKAMRAFGDSMGEEVTESEKNFFEKVKDLFD